MSMVPIDLPPGIVKQATEYSNKGRWTDGDQVRWVNGKMLPVGGNIKVHDVPITDPDTSPVRSIFSWVDRDQNTYSALGSNDKLFAYFGQDPTDSVIDITPDDLGAGSVPGYGYGSSTYGTGRYGIRVPGPVALSEHAVWAFDNYGEDLLGVHSVDGRIWRWDRDTSPVVEAAELANAPRNNIAVIVSDERHVIALGAGGDGRRIEWADREDPTDWTPTALNSAGGWDLQTPGTIVGGVRVRGGVLIITTTDCHLMRWVGGALVYAFDHAGTSCGAFSAQTIIGAFDAAFWMGQDRMWSWSGQVNPLECEVLEYVFQRMNRDRPFAFSVGANTRYNEIWFHYPLDGDLNPTQYAAFSFRDAPHWHIGSIARTAWHDNMVYNYPIAIDADGGLYFHEFGYLDNGVSRVGTVFGETAPIDIAMGERTSRCRKLYQDALDLGGNQTFPYTISLRFRPGADGQSRVEGPYVMDSNRGYTDVRGQGRQVQVRVDSAEDIFWELGVLRLQTTPGGARGY